MATLLYAPAVSARADFPHSLGMRKPSKTTLLFTLAAVTLAGTAAINIAQTDAQAARVANLTQLEEQVAGLGEDIARMESATSSAKTSTAEYRSLIVEQDAAFADKTGFIE